MKPALLLIDVQNDFLAREGLTPGAGALVRRIGALTNGCRLLGLPVFHVHTRIRRDGSDRMPHWVRNNIWSCMEDTPGALPPESLRPRHSEAQFTKQFFSAFGNAALDAALQEQGVDTLIVAGLYLHGCVRATVLDAYQRGYAVWIADDAVGSNEPGHAELTRSYLHGRAAEFVAVHELLRRLGYKPPARTESAGAAVLPAACIGGKWRSGEEHGCIERRNPSRWSEVLARIAPATGREVAQACMAAAVSQRGWQETSGAERTGILEAWAAALGAREPELARLTTRETGKPIAEAREEIRRACALIRTVAGLQDGDPVRNVNPAEPPVLVRARPQGVMGLITPWNNPVAIPVGKIAPALACGNAVVWKPALEAPRTAMAVMDALHEAGCTPGLVNLVFGAAATARSLAGDPRVAAVSLTGSIGTGRSMAALCARLGKPLQAELGGNNAAVVLRDCDVATHAAGMALAAFSFSGQRCTRIQRFVVERPLLDEFRRCFVAAVEALDSGDPLDESTRLGPLVSREHQERVRSLVAGAKAAGARILCGEVTPDQPGTGCWMRPVVVDSLSSTAQLAQEEVFGPVAVILPAADIREAIDIANGVPHGLLCAVYSADRSQRDRIAREVQAGILNLSGVPLAVHPAAPFGGWKASGLGPPEHGVWDRLFYSRTQALYPGHGMADG